MEDRRCTVLLVHCHYRLPGGEDAGEEEEEGKTATFPFLNRLFGNMGGQKPENSAPGGELTPAQSGPEQGGQSQQGPQQAPPRPKKKFLDNYCINLTDRARQGKLDAMIGREEELERKRQETERLRAMNAASAVTNFPFVPSV